MSERVSLVRCLLLHHRQETGRMKSQFHSHYGLAVGSDVEKHGVLMFDLVSGQLEVLLLYE